MGKSFQAIVIAFAAILMRATAFAPPAVQVARPAFKSAALAMSQVPEETAKTFHPNQAAMAAVITAMAPFAANAADVDEATIIGYGAGLVACVVSLAVGFSIGYGSLSGRKRYVDKKKNVQHGFVVDERIVMDWSDKQLTRS